MESRSPLSKEVGVVVLSMSRESLRLRDLNALEGAMSDMDRIKLDYITGPCSSFYYDWTSFFPLPRQRYILVGLLIDQRGRTESSLEGADHEAAAHCDHGEVVRVS
ncbi:hypothetical protein RHMOL_Rhmol04G0050500 [Rhododendron molle]|uniref:Uncharacterized protein n=1 Tax=Rhododendron molle TaxID=49168 RepID=A0ACC0NYH2_RHOML|nr:hypothetical protein RHMOL_Rhmol04G0050500 [Rhododendron molle]